MTDTELVVFRLKSEEEYWLQQVTNSLTLDKSFKLSSVQFPHL